MGGDRRTEARRWFQQASYDLKAGRWNIEGAFYETATFLAQQAGEKALKSILYYLGFRRKALLTHSLVEMIKAAGERVQALTGLVVDARRLDLHYVPSRYPNGLPSGYPHQYSGLRNMRRLRQRRPGVFESRPARTSRILPPAGQIPRRSV